VSTRLFCRYREQRDGDHYDLLHLTEVWWLSKRKALKRGFKLRIKLSSIFTHHMKQLV